MAGLLLRQDIPQCSDVFLNGFDPPQIQARPFVDSFAFVSLALTDSSQCGGQPILTGPVVPGGWPGTLFPTLSL